MSNPLENLLDFKGIVLTVVFILIVVVLLSTMDELQQGSLGDNEFANKTLEEGKKGVLNITEGFFIAGGIAGAIGVIIFFIWLYNRFEG